MWKKLLVVFVVWWGWQAYRIMDYYDMWWWLYPGWI